jgi:hypothetical protein
MMILDLKAGRTVYLLDKVQFGGKADVPAQPHLFNSRSTVGAIVQLSREV